MSDQVPTAIVGVSALFPGSEDCRGFWRDILAGKDLLGEVPPTHWLLDDYHDPNTDAADKTYARRGAFLDEVDFAPMEYGVPPNILAATDTGQLLAMIVARQLLDDAFDGPFEDADRSRTGVVLGVASTTELCLHMAGRLQQPVWEEGMRRSGLEPDEIDAISQKITDMYVPWEENTFPGLLGNVVSGRIANRFDLGGTNCVVDAACASSLAAVEMAINQLSLGQADMMIAGGVDALNDILMYMCFSKTGALSQTGDCRPFSSSADGTMLAEGLGMFALKRLDDAERDEDQIYAVIRGVGSSSDGRAKSIYAPRPEGQSKALKRAYEHADYSPRTVEMVEAHGTATPAGDAAEMRGLQAIFGQASDDTEWCALGSVKSQIGHAKAAAGAAGLFKTVMALNHRLLPPTIKVDEPNPDLELEDSPFYVNTELRPWIRGSDHPRRNAVSAFGFGGTNFHITLEEYTGPGKQAQRRRALDTELVLLSADDPQQLLEKCQGWTDELDNVDTGTLVYLARTSQKQFDAQRPARLAVVATDEEDLCAKLGQAASAIANSPKESFSAPNGIYYGFDIDPGKVAFLFPGQGSQYPNMGAHWAIHFDEARAVWDRSVDLDFGAEERLHEIVFPPPVFNDRQRQEQVERLTATEWAQPALGATSLSVHALLQKMGLEPNCMGGHSYGEITALSASGVLDEESMLRVSRKRGELMAAASSTPGAMTAVAATIETLEEKIDEWGCDVIVANHNSPTQCVLSGATDAVEEVEGRLREEKISYKRLSVSTAFHSSLVSDSSKPLLAFLENIEFGKAQCPVFANSLAAPYPDAPEEMRQILAEQLAKPVRFVEQIRAMYDRGVRTFVEVGPRSTLSRLVDKCLDNAEETTRAIHVDRRGQSGIQPLWNALGNLATSGIELDFAPLWKHYEDVDDPRDREDTGFTVSVSGTNYGKPYPCEDPRPTPDSRLSSMKREASTNMTDEKDTSPTAPSRANQSSPSAPKRTVNGASRAPATPAASSSTVAASTGDREENTPRWQQNGATEATWVDAFREQQRQTAKAHRTFQETTAQAHRAFLETMETSFQALGQLAAGEPTVQSRSSNISSPVRSNTTLSDQTVPATEGTNGHIPARPAFSPTSSSGSPPIHRRESASPSPPPAPVSPPGTTSASPAPRNPVPDQANVPTTNGQLSPGNAPETTSESTPSLDIATLLLEVVADKTGYPEEMLEPDMELEADLGVDSIKQVEIMAQMEERVPGLPEVEANDMAELRSLNAIADYLQDLMGGGAPAPESTTSSGDTASNGVSNDEVNGEVPDIASTLLNVVADKTGYPEEMLDPDMELEADLGVDSIKQVEIMAQMEERVPGLPEIEANEMAELRSLNEIAHHIEGMMGGRAPRTSSSDNRGEEESADDDAESDPGGGTEFGRYTVRPVDTPACGWSMPSLRDLQTLYIVSDESAVADGKDLGSVLVETLGDRGITAELVDTLPDGAQGAIFIDGLRSVTTLEEAMSINEAALLTAKSLTTGESTPRFFVTVQNTGGKFQTAPDNPEQSWLAGLGALVKTAGAEWPDAFAKAIDLEADELAVEKQAEWIADELLSGGPELEVGITSDGRRRTPVAFEESIDTGTHWDGLEENSVVVVSGGAKGVTAASIIELASRRPLRFVLLGRSELVGEPAIFEGIEGDAELKRVILERAKKKGEKLTPRDLQWEARQIRSGREIRQTIDRLEKTGSKARYASVDVRDGDALKELFDDIRQQWGPISSVIHGAGVLADALIEKKTPEQFQLVFGTKIEGLQALLDATSEDPLELICLFSSVAARSGNPGQSDYAMANEVLNKIAWTEAHRRGANCLVKSMGWGPWDGGMVTPSLRAHFEEQGVALLPQKLGANMLADEILHGTREDVELVLGGAVSAEGINGSELARGMTSEIVIDASTHPYLDSHRLRGTPVVPAMLVVEWFVRFAKACHPQLVVRSCRDLEVLNGIKLEHFDDDGDLLHLRATTADGDNAQNGPELHLELRGRQDQLHYRGVVELDMERHEPDDALKKAYEFELPESPWALDEVYQKGRLFHGPDFEVLTDIDGIGDNGGSASLDGLMRLNWPDENWQTDPAAMDGALQISLLWGLDLIGKQTLPMRVARFTPFTGAPSTEPLVCKVRRKKHNKRQIVADVLIFTESGELQCELNGVEMFAVPDGV